MGRRTKTGRSEVPRGEWLPLTWDRVDLKERWVRLDTGTTKNGEGRMLPVYGDMLTNLELQLQVREAECPTNPYVFFWHQADAHRPGGSHSTVPGERVRDFYTSWRTAVDAAGYKGFMFHDLRRTAQRNMSRAGIPREQRMKISGHKTDSMERRYNIVDLEDLKESRGKMDEWFRAQEESVA